MDGGSSPFSLLATTLGSLGRLGEGSPVAADVPWAPTSPLAPEAGPPSTLDYIRSHLESVAEAAGLAGFCITITYPTEDGGSATLQDAAPTADALAEAIRAIAAKNADAYGDLISATESFRMEALRKRLDAEGELAAQRAALAISRQRARAQHAVEDARMDLEEAELQLATAHATLKTKAGAELALAEEEVAAKAAWLSKKQTALDE